jgi:hypothetical protein
MLFLHHMWLASICVSHLATYPATRDLQSKIYISTVQSSLTLYTSLCFSIYKTTMLPSRGGQAARSAPDPKQDNFDRDREQIRQWVQEQQRRGSIVDYRKLIDGPLYNPNNGIMQHVTQMGALGRYGMGDRAVPVSSTPRLEKARGSFGFQ